MTAKQPRCSMAIRGRTRVHFGSHWCYRCNPWLDDWKPGYIPAIKTRAFRKFCQIYLCFLLLSMNGSGCHREFSFFFSRHHGMLRASIIDLCMCLKLRLDCLHIVVLANCAHYSRSADVRGSSGAWRQSLWGDIDGSTPCSTECDWKKDSGLRQLRYLPFVRVQ
jgi:hypothetical protein